MKTFIPWQARLGRLTSIQTKISNANLIPDQNYYGVLVELHNSIMSHAYNSVLASTTPAANDTKPNCQLNVIDLFANTDANNINRKTQSFLDIFQKIIGDKDLADNISSTFNEQRKTALSSYYTTLAGPININNGGISLTMILQACCAADNGNHDVIASKLGIFNIAMGYVLDNAVENDANKRFIQDLKNYAQYWQHMAVLYDMTTQNKIKLERGIFGTVVMGVCGFSCYTACICFVALISTLGIASSLNTMVFNQVTEQKSTAPLIQTLQNINKGSISTIILCSAAIGCLVCVGLVMVNYFNDLVSTAIFERTNLKELKVLRELDESAALIATTEFNLAVR